MDLGFFIERFIRNTLDMNLGVWRTVLQQKELYC
jgi:hypothetical protein